MPQHERFNAYSHLCGAVLTLIGVGVLVVPPLLEGRYRTAIGFVVYGVSLFLVYLASTLFHAFRGPRKHMFRQVDRIAIYVMIAGTYTPVVLLSLRPALAWPILGIVWSLATLGAVLEISMAGAKAPISIALYLLMGWMSLGILKPLIDVLGVVPVAMLVLGGVIYTIGAVALRFKIVPRHHEVWHVMVLLASGCHFAVILLYIG